MWAVGEAVGQGDAGEGRRGGRQQQMRLRRDAGHLERSDIIIVDFSSINLICILIDGLLICDMICID